MKLTTLLTTLALAATLALGAAPAQAGRSCEARQPDTTAVVRGLNLAERTARALDASGAEVVVLARAGQDLSKYRLRWSHLALAYKETTDTGTRWRVVHKLNQCGSARADLYRQGLGEFFLDDPHEFAAAFSVLSAEAQQKLHTLLHDNFNVQKLHQPAYNMVAYPWAQQYQQSNQWVIETLALAMDGRIQNRDRAQAWLRYQGYEPSVLRLGALTRLGARVSAANVAFDDHPNEKRYSDRIETITADSVFDWLPRAGLGQRLQEVR